MDQIVTIPVWIRFLKHHRSLANEAIHQVQEWASIVVDVRCSPAAFFQISASTEQLPLPSDMPWFDQRFCVHRSGSVRLSNSLPTTLGC
jgi:hypothetical protein